MITLSSLLGYSTLAVNPVIFLAIFSGFVLFYSLSYAINPRTTNFGASWPSVGWKKQWFSGKRATWRSITQSQSMIADGYIKVSTFVRYISRNTLIIFRAKVFQIKYSLCHP